jgi:hypothetical protein
VQDLHLVPKGTFNVPHPHSPLIPMTPETLVLAILAFPTAFWLVMYLIPQIFMVLRPVPDLKKRYNAEWALVTGSGSGIGEFGGYAQQCRC